MLLLSDVKSLVWTKARGEQLREMRGDISLRKLSAMVEARGFKCSWQNINLLEKGVSQSVPIETLIAILNACGRGIDSLYCVGTLTSPPVESDLSSQGLAPTQK